MFKNLYIGGKIVAYFKYLCYYIIKQTRKEEIIWD